VSAISTIAPLETALAQGFALRNATEGQPRLIILIGVWLLFVPSLTATTILAVGVMQNMLRYGASLVIKILFLVLLAGSLLSATVLFRATKNYFQKRRKDGKYQADNESKI
jgi:hypothetical protein